MYHRLFQLVQSHFSSDSPVLQASNEIVGKIKKRMGSRLNSEAVAKGLKDQVQVLENLFGFKTQPGRYVATGGRSFLLPAVRKLNDALDILHDPVRKIEEQQSFQGELSRELGEDPAAGPEGETETTTPGPTPGEALSSREKILERFSRVTERQKRCSVIQRIASSR